MRAAATPAAGTSRILVVTILECAELTKAASTQPQCPPPTHYYEYCYGRRRRLSRLVWAAPLSLQSVRKLIYTPGVGVRLVTNVRQL